MQAATQCDRDQAGAVRSSSQQAGRATIRPASRPPAGAAIDDAILALRRRGVRLLHFTVLRPR